MARSRCRLVCRGYSSARQAQVRDSSLIFACFYLTIPTGKTTIAKLYTPELRTGVTIAALTGTVHAEVNAALAA